MGRYSGRWAERGRDGEVQRAMGGAHVIGIYKGRWVGRVSNWEA